MTSCISANPPFYNAPLFPITPKTISADPQPLHESLGSWLYRFCHANGYPDISSAFLGLDGKTRLSMGASTDAPHNARGNLETISGVTNTPLEQIERLMLGQTLMTLQGKADGPRRQWLLKAASIVRAGPWMRHVICPLCVSESQEAFWLQSWRLSITTECRRHRVMLLDCCPNCGAHFVIHGKRTHPLDRCEFCNLKCNKMPVEKYHPRRSAPKFARYAGYNHPQDLPVAECEEHNWWCGIRKILCYIEAPHRAGMLTSTNLQDDFRELLLHISQNKRQCFDEWSIRHRHVALRFMDWLTTNWPHKFVNLVASTGQSYKAAACLTQCLPQWVEDALVDHANHTSVNRTRTKQLGRPLLSNPVACISIPIFKRGSKDLSRAPRNPFDNRWSPVHTAHVIQALDVRVLAMKGTVGKKARFIRGAAAIVLERGALGLCLGNSSHVAQDEPMVQALQTVNAWISCARHVRSALETNGVSPLQQSAMRLNNGHLLKWLNCESLHSQLPLFRWTEQVPGEQEVTTQ